MSAVLMLVAALVPLLQNLIGKSDSQILQQAIVALGGVLSSWGKGAIPEASGALTALDFALTRLHRDASLDPELLAQISEARAMIADAITAVEKVDTEGFDSTIYQPPPAVT